MPCKPPDACDVVAAYGITAEIGTRKESRKGLVMTLAIARVIDAEPIAERAQLTGIHAEDLFALFAPGSHEVVLVELGVEKSAEDSPLAIEPVFGAEKHALIDLVEHGYVVGRIGDGVTRLLCVDDRLAPRHLARIQCVLSHVRTRDTCDCRHVCARERTGVDAEKSSARTVQIRFAAGGLHDELVEPDRPAIGRERG